MRDLALQDLPAYSPWPARLLGLEPFEQQVRNNDKIAAEYDRDKFLACRERYRASGGTLDPVSLRFSIDAAPDRGERDTVWQGALKLATREEQIALLFGLLDEVMAAPIARAGTVVELGTAFGANLWHFAQRFPDQTFVGGDYSDNAIALAGELYRDIDNLRVDKLDFYAERYDLLDGLEAPVLVFTSQAIEQLPRYRTFLDAITRHREAIGEVIHLEPARDLDDGSLLGQMRRRYNQLNDYNPDLVASLRARESDIEIIDLRQDVFGFNAFNSLSLVHWRFR